MLTSQQKMKGIQFLRAWIAWVDSGAPYEGVFDRRDGLCINLYNYLTDQTKIPNYKFYSEIIDHWFGEDLYPFHTQGEYHGRYITATQHKCPERLKWVRLQILNSTY